MASARGPVGPFGGSSGSLGGSGNDLAREIPPPAAGPAPKPPTMAENRWSKPPSAEPQAFWRSREPPPATLLAAWHRAERDVRDSTDFPEGGVRESVPCLTCAVATPSPQPDRLRW